MRPISIVVLFALLGSVGCIEDPSKFEFPTDVGPGTDASSSNAANARNDANASNGANSTNSASNNANSTHDATNNVTNNANSMNSVVDAGRDMSVDVCVPEPEVCDGINNDCDGRTDEGTEAACPKQEGVCLGAMGSCRFPSPPECRSDEYGPNYEGSDEETCFDGLDNDCDGKVDCQDEDCDGEVCVEGEEVFCAEAECPS